MKKTVSLLLIILLIVSAAVTFTAFAEGADGEPAESAVLYESSPDGGENDILIAPAPDGEVAEDGINTNVATAWIIAVSAVFAGAIFALVIVLARKNKGTKQ